MAAVDYYTGPFIPLACFHHQPQTGLEGKFSLEFCTALSFIEGKVTLSQFTDEKVKDSAVQELVSKTRIILDPEIPKDSFTPVEIKVKLNDGRVFSQRVEAAKGEPRNPLSQEELFVKFKDCASVVLPLEESDKLLALAWDLELIRDITPLMEAATFKTKKI